MISENDPLQISSICVLMLSDVHLHFLKIIHENEFPASENEPPMCPNAPMEPKNVGSARQNVQVQQWL